MKPVKSKKASSAGSASVSDRPSHSESIPHEQVAERARALWEQRGRPSEQDLEIWLEAERQLRGTPVRDPIKAKAGEVESTDTLSTRLEREMDEETEADAPRRSATSL